MQITKEILKKHGITLKNIADATGLTHPQVCIILDEAKAEMIQREGNKMLKEKKSTYEELIKEL